MPGNASPARLVSLIDRWKSLLQVPRAMCSAGSGKRAEVAFCRILAQSCGIELTDDHVDVDQWSLAAQDFVDACRLDLADKATGDIRLNGWVRRYLVHPSRHAVVSKAHQAKMLGRERDEAKRAKRRVEGPRPRTISLLPSQWKALERFGVDLKTKGYSATVGALISKFDLRPDKGSRSRTKSVMAASAETRADEFNLVGGGGRPARTMDPSTELPKPQRPPRSSKIP